MAEKSWVQVSKNTDVANFTQHKSQDHSTLDQGSHIGLNRKPVISLNYELFWKNSLFAGLFLLLLLFLLFLLNGSSTGLLVTAAAVVHFLQTLMLSYLQAFEQWGWDRNVLPFQCSIVDVLPFYLELLDKCRSFSTITVYLAAISECISGSVEWCQVLTLLPCDFCQCLMGFAFGVRGFLWSSIWLVAV